MYKIRIILFYYASDGIVQNRMTYHNKIKNGFYCVEIYCHQLRTVIRFNHTLINTCNLKHRVHARVIEL